VDLIALPHGKIFMERAQWIPIHQDFLTLVEILVTQFLLHLVAHLPETVDALLSQDREKAGTSIATRE
jgi:hypothetical protein